MCGYVPYFELYDIQATSAFYYTASKQQAELVKIRDLVNVVHRTLNRDPNILELYQEYCNIRDSFQAFQAEFLSMGMINLDAGRSGQEHSGQWPENLFTGLNDFGHSGL